MIFLSILSICMCIWTDVDVSSAVPHSKHMEDLIIESSKFPAAQPPDPNLPSKIETEYWPCPPSLAVIGNTLSHYLIFLVLLRNCWRNTNCSSVSPIKLTVLYLIRKFLRPLNDQHDQNVVRNILHAFCLHIDILEH